MVGNDWVPVSVLTIILNIFKKMFSLSRWRQNGTHSHQCLQKINIFRYYVFDKVEINLENWRRGWFPFSYILWVFALQERIDIHPLCFPQGRVRSQKWQWLWIGGGGGVIANLWRLPLAAPVANLSKMHGDARAINRIFRHSNLLLLPPCGIFGS